MASDEAVLSAKDELRAMAAKLEKEARELRAVADAVAEIVPIAE
jgi:hypothetical protein